MPRNTTSIDTTRLMQEAFAAAEKNLHIVHTHESLIDLLRERAEQAFLIADQSGATQEQIANYRLAQQMLDDEARRIAAKTESGHEEDDMEFDPAELVDVPLDDAPPSPSTARETPLEASSPELQARIVGISSPKR
jgi:hypothetical protein